MLYLTRHSTHFLFTVIWRRTYGKEQLRLREETTWAILSDEQQGFFYMYHPRDRIAHTTAFVTPVVEHWLEREIPQWVHLINITSSLAMVKNYSLVREETRCCHIGYSFHLTARVLLYASSHRQDNTYHGLCYTSRGALVGTRNSLLGPP